MLADDGYRSRWELKKQWYRDNGVLSFAEGGGPNGVLVETSDDPRTGFDTQLIGRIIAEVLGVE